MAIKKGKALTYKQAGVDIDAGDALVDRIKPLAKATRRKGSLDDLGGFGALFDVKKAGFKGKTGQKYDPAPLADGQGTQRLRA